MANFRQRMKIQKATKKKEKPKMGVKDRRSELLHRLKMYQGCIDSFEVESVEWKICRDAIFDTKKELTLLEQEEMRYMDG